MTWPAGTWDSAFVTAVAETLAAAGVVAWSPDGIYPAGTTLPAAFVATLPDQPERAVSLTPYTVDDTVHEHVTQGLQVRSRGGASPFDVMDIDAAIYAVLHRPRGLTLGVSDPQACPVAWRQSQAAGFPPDQRGRREAVSNYYLVLGRPSAAPWS